MSQYDKWDQRQMYLKIYKFKARYENKYKETISYENKDDYKATTKILHI